MHHTASFVLLATGAIACAHSPQSRPEAAKTTVDERAPSDVAPTPAITTDPARSKDTRPLTFAGISMPRVVRLPVRADVEPGRTPNVDQVLFLRPFCIADNGESWCHDRPSVVTAGTGPAFHGDGVGVLSVIYSRDPTRLTVSLEKFDETIPLADALAFSEASAVVDDGCVTIPWSSGVGTLAGVRGDVDRVNSSGPWMFRPSPPLCAPAHVPGDDRVINVFPVTGKGTTGIPKTGLSGASMNGTLRGPSGGTSSGAFSAVADGVFPQPEWHVTPPARGP